MVVKQRSTRALTGLYRLYGEVSSAGSYARRWRCRRRCGAVAAGDFPEPVRHGQRQTSLRANYTLDLGSYSGPVLLQKHR